MRFSEEVTCLITTVEKYFMNKEKMPLRVKINDKINMRDVHSALFCFPHIHPASCWLFVDSSTPGLFEGSSLA